MKIVIGSDHAGFPLKEAIKDYLIKRGEEVIDKGTNSTASTDYPIYGKAVGESVVNGEGDLGIVICGTGVGISIAANRVKGVRAACVSEPYSAKMSRLHNNANVLALGERVIGVELAYMIVDTFLDTKFEGGRHSKRVNMLNN